MSAINQPDPHRGGIDGPATWGGEPLLPQKRAFDGSAAGGSLWQSAALSGAGMNSADARREDDPDDVVTLELPRDTSAAAGSQPVSGRRKRRVRLPVILFAATCVSTFWVGANHWLPMPIDGSFRQMLISRWQDGLIYMLCVLAILMTHEMGHFMATLRYRIPASLPYFIPFPISPIGTLGAVIGMDGLRANRKELFDIGLAGPLAGLVVAVPIMWIGTTRLDLTEPGYGPFAVDLPLAVRLCLNYVRPPGYAPGDFVWFNQLEPFFMAGWVGFLITGLNMMPVSQLDGGHVMYTLFGKTAHWIARVFVLSAVLLVLVFGQWKWSLMILLVLFIGTDHPPTSDDEVPLGRARRWIGYASIFIPVMCFAPRVIIFPS